MNFQCECGFTVAEEIGDITNCSGGYITCNNCGAVWSYVVNIDIVERVNPIVFELENHVEKGLKAEKALCELRKRNKKRKKDGRKHEGTP